MILFLDYDGVLHPDPCPDPNRLFERAPELDRVLAPFADVGIVLSTSWRNLRAPVELVASLPEGLQLRVLGVTPRFSDLGAQALRVPYRRQAECEQWLRDHAMFDCPWLALDDRPDWFAPYCENLIDCDPQRGFDDRSAARLETALTLARGRLRSEIDLIIA